MCKNEKELLLTLPCGDIVVRTQNAILQRFCGNRQVLSTSALNGGYHDRLTAIFNYDETIYGNGFCEMRAPTYEEHLRLIASEISLQWDSCTGLSTAAQMKNAAVSTLCYDDICVTAVATGGIDINGCCAGDPASWVETPRGILPLGTINIILNINAKLSKGALATALMTATEAKSQAVQELQAPSRYSNKIATGSGTDGIIVVANADSQYILTDSGKHSKLGELIGKTVICAVKETLFLQTGLSAKRQFSALSRLERFGLTKEKLYNSYSATDKCEPERFFLRLQEISTKQEIVSTAITLSHLLDELLCGMLTIEQSISALTSILGISLPDSSIESGKALCDIAVGEFSTYILKKCGE